jgi:hypothetical protein
MHTCTVMSLLWAAVQCVAVCLQACQLTVSLMSSTMSTTEASGGQASMCDTSSLHLCVTHRHTGTGVLQLCLPGCWAAGS